MPHTQEYLALVEETLSSPTKTDRTGVGTRCMGVATLQHDLRYGFPLYTCRKLSLRVMATELCWMLRGSNDTAFLKANNVRIWEPWEDILHNKFPMAYQPGQLGRVYGAQWRSFGRAHNGVDQLEAVVKSLWLNPSNRRMIVSAWSPNEIGEMALPPCHHCWQVTVVDGKFLDLMVTQRSVDLPVGCPHDVGMYALLMHVLAGPLGLTPRKLLFAFGDAHVYLDQVAAATEMVERLVLPSPSLCILHNPSLITNWAEHLAFLEHMEPELFAIENYYPHPAIKFPVAV